MRGSFGVGLGPAMVGIALGMWTPQCAAGQLDITECFSGTANRFYDSNEIRPLVRWAQDGIIISNSSDKKLDSAVVHCEGVRRGLGPEATGYGLCKIIDTDGDAITAEVPISGVKFEVKFLEGTGKWKGVSGALRNPEQLVGSKPGKGAMPGTYQGCHREKGSFELSQ